MQSTWEDRREICHASTIEIYCFVTIETEICLATQASGPTEAANQITVANEEEAARGCVAAEGDYRST